MVQLLIVVRSKPGHFVHEAMLKGSNAFVSGFTIFGTTSSLRQQPQRRH